MIIRQACPSEQAPLEALMRRASLAAPDYRDQIEAQPDAIEVPAEQIAAGRVLVAEDDAGLAGFAAWIDTGRPGEAELDALFVEPARWHGGVGRALLTAITEVAAGAGRSRLAVVANPTSLGFYRRCGFTHEGETRTRFGRAPTMAKRLAPA
ncbi:GNAT family N-acetyltransferase [Sphingosinicella sp.]|uniref:GNAT family N-acetyltransferase n=1 Tax=Sphingosinicella sp. TaxID=1917971 RepID=UPI004037883C